MHVVCTHKTFSVGTYISEQYVIRCMNVREDVRRRLAHTFISNSRVDGTHRKYERRPCHVTEYVEPVCKCMYRVHLV